jgi:hypothetical protein
MELSREELILQAVLSITTYEQIQEVADRFGMAFEAVRGRLRRRGVKIHSTSKSQKISNARKAAQLADVVYQGVLEDVRKTYAADGPALIAEKHGVSLGSVMTIANRLGIASLNKAKRAAETQVENNWNCDYEAFDDPLSEDACYFLGLLWADASIAPNNTSWALRFQLTEPEWHLVYDFATFVGWTGGFTPPHRQSQHHLWQTGVDIGNKNLVSKLMDRGMVPRKSYVDPNPLQGIPDYLYHHFARGWFDGDGSPSYGGVQRLTTPRLFWCGSHKALVDLRDNIVRLTGVSRKEPYRTHRTETNKCWGVVWSSWDEVSRLMEWMHQDGGYYAYRKHDPVLVQLGHSLVGGNVADEILVPRPRSFLESRW